MAILNIQVNNVGQAGVVPGLIFIETNNTLDEVTTPGFLNSAIAEGNPITEYQCLLVSTKTSPNAKSTQTYFFTIQFSSGISTLSQVGASSGVGWLVDGNDLAPSSLAVLGTTSNTNIDIRANNNSFIFLDTSLNQTQIVSDSFLVDVSGDVDISSGDGSINIDSSSISGQSVNIGVSSPTVVLGSPLLQIPAIPQAATLSVLFYNTTTKAVTFDTAPIPFDPSADITFTGNDMFTGQFTVASTVGDVNFSSASGNLNIFANGAGSSATLNGDTVTIGSAHDVNVLATGDLVESCVDWTVTASGTVTLTTAADFNISSATPFSLLCQNFSLTAFGQGTGTNLIDCGDPLQISALAPILLSTTGTGSTITVESADFLYVASTDSDVLLTSVVGIVSVAAETGLNLSTTTGNMTLTANGGNITATCGSVVSFDGTSVQLAPSTATVVGIGNATSVMSINSASFSILSGISTDTGTIAAPTHTPPAGYNYLAIGAAGDVIQFAA